mmetsp:Transcript_59015/g.164898  ORF Transcript_59015/g.164898 Transcript_59015/m.164898 type:complete len:435 (-) Transcript_59015:155-1459(-)
MFVAPSIWHIVLHVFFDTVLEIVHVPFDEPIDADVQRCRRHVAQLLFREAGVGTGFEDVAGWRHGNIVPDRLLPHRLLKALHEVRHRDRVLVAEVVDQTLRGLLGGRRDSVHGGQASRHDVIDVCEVALQFRPAWALEDFQRLSVRNFLGEREGRHVGTSPGPVHRKEAKAYHGQPVDVRVRVRHHLVGLLSCRVEARRVIDLVRFSKGRLGVQTINGTGRRVDDAGHGVARSGGLQELNEARHVGCDVRGRILGGVTNPSLGGKGEDVRDLVLAEDMVEKVPLVDICLECIDALAHQVLGPFPLEARRVVGAIVVDTDDAIASTFQCKRTMVADETRRACHEHHPPCGRLAGFGRCQVLDLPPRAAAHDAGGLAFVLAAYGRTHAARCSRECSCPWPSPNHRLARCLLCLRGRCLRRGGLHETDPDPGTATWQ